MSEQLALLVEPEASETPQTGCGPVTLKPPAGLEKHPCAVDPFTCREWKHWEKPDGTGHWTFTGHTGGSDMTLHFRGVVFPYRGPGSEDFDPNQYSIENLHCFALSPMLVRHSIPGKTY